VSAAKPKGKLPADLDNILRRGVIEIIPEQEFVEALGSGRKLRLKLGLDPSKPDLHIGHAVLLRKLRRLQELGHQVVLIVGDWTAQIGDPSGQSIMRPMLTADEVKANAETYMRQFFHVVDREKTEVRWQSEWFGTFTLEDVVRLAGRFTVAQMLQREDFRQRFEAHKPLGIHELLYPLLQAYDSVVIEADVEFGGSDQRFNLLVGRELQEEVGQRPQACFIMHLLVGTDGAQKMSKSLGNTIDLEDPPHEQYGKVMSIPDRALLDYLELTTDVPDEELAFIRKQLEERAVNPMAVKKRLARDIVSQFHGTRAAREAEEDFTQRHQVIRPEPVAIQVTIPEPRVLLGPPPEVVVANLRRFVTYNIEEGLRTAADAIQRFQGRKPRTGYEVFLNSRVCRLPAQASVHAGDVIVLLTRRLAEEVQRGEARRGWKPLWNRTGLADDLKSMFRAQGRRIRVFEEFKDVKFLAIPFRATPGADAPPRWLKGDGWNLANIIADVGLTRSSSVARTEISQGAVDLNGERVKSTLVARSLVSAQRAIFLRVGKHRFLRIVDADSRETS
jgi:tyrosyl-tRNA synthetase